MHVLIYFVAGDGGALGEELRRLQDARDERNGRMLARLSDELGLPVTRDEVEQGRAARASAGPTSRPSSVRKGVVASIQEAFDRFLAKGQPGYVEKTRLLPQQAIAAARRSGAVPVLAHPLSLGLEPPELDRLVGDLAADGLARASRPSTAGTAPRSERLADLARRHGLVATGGSDHHGTYKADLSVGVGRGDLEVPDDALEELAARRPSG